MTRMQARTASFAPSPGWLNPFGSWEAVARWNAMAFEWMTNGWKQWLELSTTWPALERAEAATAGAAATASAVPAQAGTQEARNARSVGNALDSRLRGNDERARANDETAKPRASSAKRASARTEGASAGRREARAAASAGTKRSPARRPAGTKQAAPRPRSRSRG